MGIIGSNKDQMAQDILKELENKIATEFLDRLVLLPENEWEEIAKRVRNLLLMNSWNLMNNLIDVHRTYRREFPLYFK